MSSDSSSPAITSSAPPRRRARLLGPSPAIDPSREAWRHDLADAALAGRAVAQFYAEPALRRLAVAATLRDAARADAGVRAELPAGAAFALLEIADGWAWGRAPEADRAGYLPADALAPL